MAKLRPWVTLLWILSSPLLAASYYVAPTGSPSGDGSKQRPWDLVTALAQPPAVKPGDTIWLTGGTYVGHFTSSLKGTLRAPIVVRQADGERATIDGNDGGNAVTLLVNGSDTWFWGFEITNTNTGRLSTTTANPPGRGEGVNLLGPRTRLINLAIHDTSQGVLTTTDIANTEITGCLIYYNGYDGPDRGHGHGIYIQNAAPSTKHVLDNIIFAQYGYGIHAYTEGGMIDNLDFEGNTSFNNGVLSQVSGLTTDILVGANGSAASSADSSTKVAKNTTLESNYTYYTGGGTSTNLGFTKGIASPTVVDNYFVGGTALTLVNAFAPITMQGNTFYGRLSGLSSSQFPSNTYSSSQPAGARVFIRPNKYELGRANITIYNWDGASAVDVDLKNTLKPGAKFELRNAQNFFAAPLLSGVYEGGPLHIPMTGLTAATPVGLASQATSGPEFQVFVLIQTSPTTSSRERVEPPAQRTQVHPLGARSDLRSENARAPSAVSAAFVESPSAEAPDLQPCTPAVAAETAALAPAGDPAAAPDGLRHVSYFPGVVGPTPGSTCRTSLSATNVGERAATVRVTFLEHDADNTNAPSVSVVLNPGESLGPNDVPESLFGSSGGYGTLEVDADDGVRVGATTGSSDSGEPVALQAFSADDLSPTRTLSAVDVGRSDLHIVNPNSWGGPIAITLAGPTSGTIGTAFLVVPPHGYVRRDLAALFGSAEFSDDPSQSIVVDSGGLLVLAFASASPPPRSREGSNSPDP